MLGCQAQMEGSEADAQSWGVAPRAEGPTAEDAERKGRPGL